MRNKGFNNHHNGPWKKYMKQNKMEKPLQIKRGKMQLKPDLGISHSRIYFCKNDF